MRTSIPPPQRQVEKPFWMGTTEVTLEQYQQFDPDHHNGYYDMHYKDQVKPGYLMDFPRKPGHPGLLAAGHGVLPMAVRSERAAR